ncbi:MULTISPECIES: hypothetical protein [Natrinema]|uniref:Uncharacterized protein n=1 Tax=Natrinema gari JCM 14663 TaxID=1230459 RepID=L9Z0C7_9EURY|nr:MULTISPECIES: hypothetical protein [Natrinema]AFO55636.1 hypothetical protein NJ7G_0383 [Natrinema sp. J7-2]ELY79147.1 hypothetical protein C486_12161 [Natrinema gari JCM 14663]
MVGTTLRDIRTHIERLASDDGEYYVVCARSGERPVPVAGQRFATRADAADAAQATEQYRAALRRYDPQLPFYDPVVCQERPAATDTDGRAAEAPQDTTQGVANDETHTTPPSVDRDPWDDSPLISFCHDVSGAVFESLSARDHEAAERAIMETYLAAAEATTDRNTLCLVLLETMASELEAHLETAERMQVLRAAATNLSPVEPAADPVAASLAFLDSLSLIREYGVTRNSTSGTDDDIWTVSLRGYAIECGESRFPTLPIGIDILRRSGTPSEPLGVTDVTALGEGDWQFVLRSDATASGLVCTWGESR